MSQTANTTHKNNQKLENLSKTVNGFVIQPALDFAKRPLSPQVETFSDFINDRVASPIRTASENISRAFFAWIVLSLFISLIVHFEPTFASEHPLIYDFSQLGLNVFEVSLEFGKECIFDIVNYFKDITFFKVISFPFWFFVEFFKNLSVFAKLF